jgi:lysophospholipase L1-like esterase
MHTKVIKRFCTLFLCGFLLLPYGFRVKAESVKQKALVYTALGDSISTGYRLSNTSNAYVSLFGKYLGVSPVNLGQNGLDSAGLLKKLNDDSKVIDQIKKSDVVTVSMGGNDMLKIFSGMQPTSISTLIDALKQLQSTAMQKKFDSGISTFSGNWAKIIERIKSLSPKAVIIVTTLYNPYQKIVVNIPAVFSFDLGAYADRYVKQINAVITKNAGGNYLVADSYTLFQKNKSEDLTNANLSKMEFDPHPNILGHSLLFKAHEAVKINFVSNAVAIKGADSVSIPASSSTANAKYSAQPLYSCFSSSGVTPAISYSVVEAGSTGAVIDSATGDFTVKKPGQVKIKAAVSMPNTNLSAEEVKTIRVVKLTPSGLPEIDYRLPICAGIALLLTALLFFFIRRAVKRSKK